MAKKIPNVDILTETFDTWLNRTNSVIDILSTEVITANTSLGVTGTPTVPVNARLWGTFTANTLVSTTSFSVPNSFSVNTSIVSINSPILVNGSIGSDEQILASTGSGATWKTFKIETPNNSGLIGGPITSTGQLKVKAGTGIIVDNAGVSVNISYIASQITNTPSLDGFTWESPGTIGSVDPNTGVFTTVTADSYRIRNVSTDSFLLDSNIFRTPGWIDSITPGNGINNTTGGVRVRARGTGRASIQFTNQAASTEYGALTVGSDGILRWRGSISISESNAGGGGLILSDDGDIVDLNDGYGSFRFSNGIAVYSTKNGGSQVIRLKNTGDIEAVGNVYSNNNQRLVSINEFTNGSGVGGGSTSGSTANWVKLPNGMLLQWGTIPARQDSYTTLYFPQAFATNNVAVTCSGGIKVGNTGAGENGTTVYEVRSTYFKTWTTENVQTTAWWVAMGF